jgi:hypoxanthine phosphoribosyltransferase
MTDHPDIVEVLISKEAIEKRVVEMGKEISFAYAGTTPLLVGVLKGSSLFMADLVRQINIPMVMDFMAVASYADPQSRGGGAVRVTKDLDSIIEGKDVLLVDGILDTGMTLGYIFRNLIARKPHSLRLCTFLEKRARRIVEVPVAFRGFEIPDRFVVGYGLDFRQLYRNLPYVGVLSDSVTLLDKK